MGSASGTVAARYNLRGSSEIVPSLSVRLMACWRPLAPVASTWPSEPQAPSQNGAQAANGRKIANRLSLTLAARRFARLDTSCKSLPQRHLPLRTNSRTEHPSGAKAQSHHSDIRVAEPGKSQISNLKSQNHAGPRPSWPAAPAESREYTIWPASFPKKIGDA